MEKLFVTKLEIKKVRHLKDITINLSDTTSRHLIFTGKNGSGKTSVLDAIAAYLKMKFQVSDLNLEKQKRWILMLWIQQNVFQHISICWIHLLNCHLIMRQT